MGDTYYQYKDVKVMIAHKLMSMDGWTVYGYSPDNSDPMTDYYDPAYWGGVAEKNGYVLCVNVYGASKGEEIRRYNTNGVSYDTSIPEKIAKLERMTVERGASEAEEASAKAMIQKLQKKAEEVTENRNPYVVVGHIPAHMAHPPKMNWHIEKDGIIIAKGNGILKYAEIEAYYNYQHYMEDMQDFKAMSREEYKQKLIHKYMCRWNDTEKQAIYDAESHIKDMEKNEKLFDQFEAFINKLDTTCGGLLGDGDGTIYEKVTVTEYKKELKPVEVEKGSLKEGQCFILKTSFNYGRNKGYVYRIHERELNGKTTYHAVKLNGKYTKECNGTANPANHWYMPNLDKWITKGAIAWCELQEVKTPYEVEKVVKRTIKTDKNTKNAEAVNKAAGNIDAYTYEISEDTDTRTNEKIWLVKVKEHLSREEYLQVNEYIKSLGGYYSRFKRAFLFKENPTEKLKIA